MPIHVLNQASSLNPGADFWVTPQLPFSKSAQRLDWYVNFLLTKSSLHKPRTLSPELVELMKATGLEILSPAPEQPLTDSTHDPAVHPMRVLLIPTAQHLPNRWLAQVTFFPDRPESWIEKIFNCWKDLGHPSIRVFLPTHLNNKNFIELWNRKTPFDDFSIVND